MVYCASRREPCCGPFDPEYLLPTLHMSNHRVLVTAGASGIGREIVRAFATGGATVFVCDIDSTGLDVLSQEIAGLKTGVCDISNRKDVNQHPVGTPLRRAVRPWYC
jgi:nucleoside-diphosphate-sugar epimerase